MCLIYVQRYRFIFKKQYILIFFPVKKVLTDIPSVRTPSLNLLNYIYLKSYPGF